jgi:peptidoglycan/LPS O-acetylase OafA/YrhL
MKAVVRLNGFDGMRALACLAVLFHHLMQRLGAYTQLRNEGDIAEAGVSLFFVLSGALLSYPFWQCYLNHQAFPSIKRYAIARAARIMPAFYIVLTVSCLASWLWGFSQYTGLRFFLAAIFVAPYHYLSFFPADFNGPLWSIGLEVSCYMLLPLMLYWVWHFGKAHWLKGVFFLVGCIVVLQLLNPFVIQWTMTEPPYKGWEFGMIGGGKLWLPYWNITTFMSQFLCGSLAALGIAGVKDRLTPLAQVPFDVLAIVSFVVGCWFIGEYGQPGSPSDLTHQPYVAPWFSLFCGVTLFALAMSRYVYRLFDIRLMQIIARWSFGIYLWHMLIIELVRVFVNDQFYYHGIADFTQWLLLSALVVSVSVTLAGLSFHYIEQPILNWAKKRSA